MGEPIFTRPRTERQDIDDNAFNILVEGEVAFYVERERLSNGARWFWLVYRTADRSNHIDRDKYSNDIMERATYGRYD